RRAGCFNDRQALRIPQWFEGGHGRMQSKEPVKVERCFDISSLRFGNGDRRAQVIVVALAVRNHHVQAVDRSTLENRNQSFATAASDAFTRLAPHSTFDE